MAFLVVRRFFSLASFVRSFAHFLEFSKKFLYGLTFYCFKNAVLLQDFAAYVKRQIFRVNNAAHKAKVCRKQFAVVVRDETRFT